MSEHDWAVLVEDGSDMPPMSLEERASAIAEELRKGNPSKLFCKLLAGMIDPNGKNATRTLFRLSYKNTGRPRSDKRLSYFMERLVDQRGFTIDAAVHEAQKAFGEEGHSRSSCLAALARVRETRALERDFREYLARQEAAKLADCPE
ncbi:hypothetical protein [Prosthecomicrobium pneumaticum]|uniref:Uncharacterized protein n=1 Tax=Prosthecomicrobium pneumaticum TaxID=81895 RepID=A0A7W9FPE0_9HYPH|nr:hypothetical protein [Prosthecomicrobium pneumaticum]MBB5754352.1 hypothetical protein [Prosthecomicrobium pneumaticum]